MPRIALAVALGVGTGGALIDVSSYARLETGISYAWGRESQYDELKPGEFSFVLENRDGRFTPENTASPLATKLTEGLAVCVQIGTRLTAGTVRSIEPRFPNDEAAWSEVTVSCEDMLGVCARTNLDSGWRAALVAAASPVGYYPMSEPAGDTPVVYDQSGRRRPAYQFFGGTVTFEIPGEEHDQVEVSTAAGVTGDMFAVGQGLNSIGGGSYISLWITPMSVSGTFLVGLQGKSIGIRDGRIILDPGTGSMTTVLGPAYTIGRTYFIQKDAATLYVDGVNVGTSTGTDSPSSIAGDQVRITYGDANALTVRISDLALTDAMVQGELLQSARPAGGPIQWVALMDAVTPWVTFNSVPAGMSQAPLILTADGGSLLDALELLTRGEQGYVQSDTTGTLTAPVEKLTLRRRSRPEAVSASFDVEVDLDGAPNFVRDVRNVVRRVTVRGPVFEAVVHDDSLIARSGGSTAAEDAAYVYVSDLRSFGEDRLVRGANTTMGVQSVVVDAMTTQTDRSANLLALRLGDRVRITGLPSTQIGFASWDGWLVGVEESHTLEEHRFTLALAPTLAIASLFDTARFMAGGKATLAAAVTAADTTLSVSTTGGLLSTAATPYTIVIDSEQMTVTAVTGTSSPQSATVTRGAGGTTAAAHASAAALTVLPPARFIY